MVKAEKIKQKLNQMIEEGFIQFLSKVEVSYCRTFGKPEIFPAKSDVFYRGHYPIGVYILVYGSLDVNCFNARKIMKIRLEKPVMLGVNHILNLSEYRYSVCTNENSSLIFLPRHVFVENLIKKEKIRRLS